MSADGEMRLSGFGVSRRGDGTQGSALKELARVGEVILDDSNLVYRDDMYGIRLGFSDISGRLTIEGDELSAQVRASLRDDRGELVFGEIAGAITASAGVLRVNRVPVEGRKLVAEGNPLTQLAQITAGEQRVGRQHPGGRPPRLGRWRAGAGRAGGRAGGGRLALIGRRR